MSFVIIALAMLQEDVHIYVIAGYSMCRFQMPSQADCQQQLHAAQQRSSELQHAVAQRESDGNQQALTDQKVPCLQILDIVMASRESV